MEFLGAMSVQFGYVFMLIIFMLSLFILFGCFGSGLIIPGIVMIFVCSLEFKFIKFLKRKRNEFRAAF